MKARNPGNTISAMHLVFDLLTTPNDIQIENVLTMLCISNGS